MDILWDGDKTHIGAMLCEAAVARNEMAHNEKHYSLFNMLKPQFGVDGNQWFVLLGDLPTGIAGFGNTLYDAIGDWNCAFHKKLPERNMPAPPQACT